MSQERSFGWRDLLGAVNLRDFAHMVGGELAQVTTSTRLAFEQLPKLPLGPLLFVAGFGMALFRLLLLVFVVFAFGGAILVITVVRAVTRLRGRSTEGK